MPRPIHFEIPSDNPEGAIGFYTNVFGWTFTKWEGPAPYWLITTGPKEEPGIDGGLLQRRDPNQPCVNTIGVANVDETIKTVERNGGKIAVPKMAVPGIGWLAYCKDTDANMFGVMQMDPAAA